MFDKLFGGARKSPGYLAGQDLFQKGMAAAQQYRTAEAVRLYTASFEAEPNPAPLINRAKLYRWRLLFGEAIRDLELAQRLDREQSNEFGAAIEDELSDCRVLATSLFNGKRELFVADLRENGFDYVAGRLADTLFRGEGRLLAYHVMNEIDNVEKFEDIADFPAIARIRAQHLQDDQVINAVLENRDIQRAFEESGTLFQMMLCVYDYPDMARLRDLMVEKIWNLLNSAAA